jgi:hypothetical protein
MGIFAVHIYFLGKWKIYSVINFAKLIDLRIIAWLLVGKLIARKAKNN